MDNWHEKVCYFFKKKTKLWISVSAICSMNSKEDVCIFHLFFLLLISARQNKRKIYPRKCFFSTSLMSRVSMNGRDCKRIVTRMLLRAMRLSFFLIISTVTVSIFCYLMKIKQNSVDHLVIFGFLLLVKKEGGVCVEVFPFFVVSREYWTPSASASWADLFWQ